MSDLDFSAGMSAENQELWRLAEQGAEPLAERLVPELVGWIEELKNGESMDAVSEWLRQMFFAALDEAWAQGPDGVIDDQLVLARPWGFDVADIAVPTRIMAAREDKEVPASHGRWLAAHVPGAVHIEMPGGHLGPQDDEEESLMGWLASGDEPRPWRHAARR
jgi:pimeloyl-ACP methyl ester carboxylesterase